MGSPLRICVGVREEQLFNFCTKILRCLDSAPCSLSIKAFRSILEQAVMGRYVMNESYSFLLKTHKTCLFRAFKGRHPSLLHTNRHLSGSLRYKTVQRVLKTIAQICTDVLFRTKNCCRIKGSFFDFFFF